MYESLQVYTKSRLNVENNPSYRAYECVRNDLQVWSLLFAEIEPAPANLADEGFHIRARPKYSKRSRYRRPTSSLTPRPTFARLPRTRRDLSSLRPHASVHPKLKARVFASLTRTFARISISLIDIHPENLSYSRERLSERNCSSSFFSSFPGRARDRAIPIFPTSAFLDVARIRRAITRATSRQVPFDYTVRYQPL